MFGHSWSGIRPGCQRAIKSQWVHSTTLLHWLDINRWFVITSQTTMHESETKRFGCVEIKSATGVTPAMAKIPTLIA